MEATKEEVKGAIAAVAALAEAIRALGSVPNGHLYAQVMGSMTFAFYERAIGVLKGAGLVAESNNLLPWVGPEVAS